MSERVRKQHPVYKQLRELRESQNLSLQEAAEITGVTAIATGSYERGDRQPPVEKVEQILNGYGWTLVAVPKDFNAARLPADMASELRAIADQIVKMRGRK